MPAPLRGDVDAVYKFCVEIVEATADVVCAYKPQFAYFAAQRAERNDHVVRTGQAGNMGIRSQGCEIHGMQMQPWVCDVRHTPTLGMQGMHFG